MQSMTGFGFSSVSTKDFKLEVSVKSVNSRFLDIKFYTPTYYIPLEPELRKLIFKKCKRGYFVVHIERYPQKPMPVISLKWDKGQAQKWKKLYENLSKEMKFKNDLTVDDLINREGVVHLIEKPQSLSPQEKKKVNSSFNRAFQTCLQERKREGLVLKKDILFQLQIIQSFFQKIKLLNKKQKELYISKKNKYIKQNSKQKDLILEIEKFDIHEEIVRLEEHLKHFKKMISSSSAIGRKLDFYVQEILRELNTMGSKSHLSDLTLKVVEGKFALEKIKEQIQNVE